MTFTITESEIAQREHEKRTKTGRFAPRCPSDGAASNRTAPAPKRPHSQNPANPRPSQPKSSKYKNRRTVVDGITFHSKKEADRWTELRLLAHAGKIRKLVRQVRHELWIGDCLPEPILIATYVSDFEYDQDGKHVVEDVKGCRTREYQIKKRLMLALEGISIYET